MLWLWIKTGKKQFIQHNIVENYMIKMLFRKNELNIDFTLFACGFFVLLAIVMLLPLGFGGNRNIPFHLYQAGLSVSLLLTAFAFIINPTNYSPQFPKSIMWIMFLCFLIIGWGMFQIQTWVPQSWHHPIWSEIIPALRISYEEYRGSISPDPASAWHGLNVLFTMMVTGFLFWIFGRNEKYAGIILESLLVATVFYAIYGLVNFGLGIEKILWFEKESYIGTLTSTFVNRNHAATYFGMGLVTASGLFWHGLTRVTGGQNMAKMKINSQSVVYYFQHRGILYLLAMALLACALLCTQSRAGLASTLSGLFVMASAFFIYIRKSKKGYGSFARISLAIILLFLLAFIVFVGHPLLERYARVAQDGLIRFEIWEVTWQAVKDSPWLGYGLNNFDSVFRFYRDENITSWIHRAHNDWLESLFSLGWGGFIALVMLWISIIAVFIRGIINRRRNGIYPAIALGCTVLVLSHALVDFSLQMPGVAMTYALIAGLGLAQSFSSRS